MVNLLNFDRQGLAQFFESIGEKPFRAKQVLKWMHQYGVTDFEKMTDLSKSLRAKLEKEAYIKAPKVVFSKPSEDGTHKWLIEMVGGNCVETVFIPEEKRGTLCVSSQVGCILNCSFCSTGKQGFNRNLSVAEIIGQVWVAVRGLAEDGKTHDHKVTNIVMMGMGEPLMNFEAVISAMDIMLDDLAYGFAKRRVTLSTSGVVPKIYELAERSKVSLAVSLHAPNDPLRDILVPINKKYKIDELLKACQHYLTVNPHKHITFEYVMIQEVNDTPGHAHELAELLEHVPSKINLIPFNPFPGTEYKKSSNNRIHNFQRIMQDAGFVTTIRKTRGDDIDAACGQLVGTVEDITRRKERIALKKERENK